MERVFFKNIKILRDDGNPPIHIYPSELSHLQDLKLSKQGNFNPDSPINIDRLQKIKGNSGGQKSKKTDIFCDLTLIQGIAEIIDDFQKKINSNGHLLKKVFDYENSRDSYDHKKKSLFQNFIKVLHNFGKPIDSKTDEHFIGTAKNKKSNRKKRKYDPEVVAEAKKYFFKIFKDTVNNFKEVVSAIDQYHMFEHAIEKYQKSFKLAQNLLKTAEQLCD